MKRKIISLAIIGLLIGMLFNLTGCVGILTGLGLYVANEASDTVVKADAMSAAEINAFNSKFNQYEGENVSGTNVKSLLNGQASVKESVFIRSEQQMHRFVEQLYSHKIN